MPRTRNRKYRTKRRKRSTRKQKRRIHRSRRKKGGIEMVDGMEWSIRMLSSSPGYYTGDVNSNRKPHGVGYWKDKDEKNKYIGKWKNGFIHEGGIIIWGKDEIDINRFNNGNYSIVLFSWNKHPNSGEWVPTRQTDEGEGVKVITAEEAVDYAKDMLTTKVLNLIHSINPEAHNIITNNGSNALYHT